MKLPALTVFLTVPQIRKHVLYTDQLMNDTVRYLEEEVVSVRRELALSTALCRLDRSPHVGHLKQNRAHYVKHLDQFISDCAL
jgi:hypothetical protein